MSVRAGFRAGDRHGFLAEWTSLLAQVQWGRAAAGLLDGPLPSRCALVALPMWSWHEPLADVGRKASARGGGKLLLPVRMVWSPGPLALVPAKTSLEASWSAEGLGLRISGHCTISATSGFHGALLAPDEPSTVLVAGVQDRASLRQALDDLVEQGRRATWEAVEKITPFAVRSVERAHRSMSVSALGEDGGPLLSPTTLSKVVDSLTIGEEGPLETAPLGRIIESLLDPAATVRVDPQRFLMVALDRDAMAALRREVGDPHMGSKVRSVAREVGWSQGDAIAVRELLSGVPRSDATRLTVDAIIADYRSKVDEIIDVYRERYPADQLGLRRTVRALTVSPDPLASAVPLDRQGA